MKASLLISPPTTEQSSAMASVMQLAATPLMHRTTLIGCIGLREFLHDQIAVGSENQYLTAIDEGRLVGMSAWRREGECLYLNHLFVHPLVQRQGIGTALLRAGLVSFESGETHFLGLDVHEDNRRAWSWYQKLGLIAMERKIVMEVPLTPSTKVPHGDWSSTFQEEGVRAHARYGFSSFTLKTASGSYKVGRLGSSFFRVTSGRIAQDRAALCALFSLDPQRTLLCFGTVGELHSNAVLRGQVLGATQRLMGRIEPLVARLNAYTAV